MTSELIRSALHSGIVIPAHPLALDENRLIDERCQRGLSRYYLAAGAGGLAVGVHTTQFAIHNSNGELYRRVLRIAAEEMDQASNPSLVRVAGLIGTTSQAVREACWSRDLGYHLGLLSLSAMHGASEDELIAHCREVADHIGVFGFYLQPEVGGLNLSYSFWRRFVEIQNVVAIKIAAFDRYRTIDVVRAVCESGRQDIALYTGNDDNIVADLIATYRFSVGDAPMERSFAGGLLGHWAVWTKRAVELLKRCQKAGGAPEQLQELLVRNIEVTDCNAALFDPMHGYSGCIPGIMEVLRRQGLVSTNYCLDKSEVLSPGQANEIDRVCQSYPHLIDDEFVRAGRDEWLSN